MTDVRGVRGGCGESGLTWKDEDGLYDVPKKSSCVDEDPECIWLEPPGNETVDIWEAK